MTKLILIDLDDTLWDTQANNKESLYEVYTALGWGQYFLSFEAYFSDYNLHNMWLWGELAKGRVTKDYLSMDRLRYPLRAHHYLSDEACREANELFYEGMKRKTKLCSNALSVMEYLHNKYSVCILSNGFAEVQKQKVQGSGLAPWVDEIILSEEAPKPKPDRAIFDMALQRMGVSSGEAVMIGDSWGNDIVGAANAGIPSIWYNPHGLRPMPEATEPPMAEIVDLAQLMTIL